MSESSDWLLKAPGLEVSEMYSAGSVCSSNVVASS